MKKIIIQKEKLLKEYVENRKPATAIAKELNCSRQIIYNSLREYEIPIRGPYGKILKDYTGHKFGGWTVIEKCTGKSATWICQCLCGIKKPVKSSNFLQCGKCNNCTKIGYGEITGTRWSNIRNGAIQRKIPFEISVKYAWELYLSQNKKCNLSGLPIVFAPRKKSNPTRKTSTASLDRIDSSKGYFVGNVQWVYKKINMMKQGFDQKEFIDLCRKIGNYAK